MARPPGHHAEKNKAMGFCCISNAGVATNYLVSKYKYKRIACVDFDVHWGNGNYDVMRNNKNSLYISTHQYPFYPGGGTDKDKGDFNNSLNIPLPAGTNSEEYFNAFDRVLERLVQYKPDDLFTTGKAFVSNNGKVCFIYWDLDADGWRMATELMTIKAVA